MIFLNSTEIDIVQRSLLLWAAQERSKIALSVHKRISSDMHEEGLDISEGNYQARITWEEKEKSGE